MKIIRHIQAENRHLFPLLLMGAAIWIGAADISSGPSAHVGYISLNRIGTEATAAVAGAKRLDAMREEKRRAIAEKQRQLEGVRLQLANSGGYFQASKRDRLRKDEERVRVELARLSEQSQTEVQGLQRQLQGELKGQLDGVLAEVAARRRVDLVLNADTAVVWTSSAQDLTADTIKGLNARDAKK